MHLFLLSSRLFAITFFTVSYKWWVIGVLIFHSIITVIIDTILFCVYDEAWFLFLCLPCTACTCRPSLMSALMQKCCGPCWACCRHCVRDDISESDLMQNCCSPFLFCCLHWLRDDMSKSGVITDNDDHLRKAQIRRMRICNILFVLENLFMILLFYFSQSSDTWYSLPVTICVCFFSIFGAIVRVIQMRFLFKHYNNLVSRGRDPSGLRKRRSNEGSGKEIDIIIIDAGEGKVGRGGNL